VRLQTFDGLLHSMLLVLMKLTEAAQNSWPFHSLATFGKYYLVAELSGWHVYGTEIVEP